MTAATRDIAAEITAAMCDTSMMDMPMSADTRSPLRRVLCSISNAARVATWMRLDGIHTDIVATGGPLQHWLIVETTAAMIENARACA